VQKHFPRFGLVTSQVYLGNVSFPPELYLDHLGVFDDMSQAAAIVLSDGQATPVAVTFSPEKVTPEMSIFADRASGISLQFRRLRASFSPATATRTTNRASFEVVIPVTSVVNGVTTVAFTMRGKLDMILPDGSSDQNRKDLYAFMKNGLANALLTGNLRDLDPLY
jgi:hypothetical protein